MSRYSCTPTCPPWAPPIEGRLFLGLANPGQMAQANYAELIAMKAGCKQCAAAARTSQRDPFEKSSYLQRKLCQASKCNPHIKKLVERNCNIYGPTY